MSKKKVEEIKIFQILKEAESGIPMKELSRKYGFTVTSKIFRKM